MNRSELDAFVVRHALAGSAIEVALDESGARPSREETLHFGVRSLQLAGALSLAAGVIFFVAANWDVIGVFGRFALLQVLVAGFVGVALWQPPPARWGQFALLGAFICSGALFALFGQTYQTGANAYELFLSWAMLGLPFVMAGRWSVLWAAWLLVLNLSLALYCGFSADGGLLWLMLSGFDREGPLLLLVPMVVNLALLAICQLLALRQFVPMPQWLQRLIAGCAIAFGTWSLINVIFTNELGRGYSAGANWVAGITVTLSFAGLVVFAFRSKRDVFPMAAIAASLILLGTLLLAKKLDWDEPVLFFILALWLIGSSTLCGRMLMTLVRRWGAASS